MTLQERLVEEMRDLYHAEKQLVRALPKMAKAATHDDLREAIEMHLEETKEQVTRLEEAFSALDEKARAKNCPGMAGILEEGSDLMHQEEPGAVMDAALIASAQRVEHYEIGAYGTCAAWARLLGLEEVVSLLEQTLEEEKATDRKLTALAEQEVNLSAATEGRSEEEEEEDEEEDEEEEPGRMMGRRTNARQSSRATSMQRQSSTGRSTRARAADRRR